MLKLILFSLRLYQRYLSPLKAPTCRFYPTCSDYSVQSFEKHGLMGGVWRTTARLLKCHPYHPGGYDPVD
jgi:hypothetical protein